MKAHLEVVQGSEGRSKSVHGRMHVIAEVVIAVESMGESDYLIRFMEIWMHEAHYCI